ncbi:MAG: hypothetical protein AAGC60_07040 [Acidobacteriota bacterium]
MPNSLRSLVLALLLFAAPTVLASDDTDDVSFVRSAWDAITSVFDFDFDRDADAPEPVSADDEDDDEAGPVADPNG